ncbi:hypothetical protein ONS95_013822 [Cadophora gregata]|uniref:uncharacterized protein n=1 Tax=Cadophora gregata TaxID=51156 RepID=UPI0026DAB102|nr:uncharacterized protein ONS95_013822 [Cadophora gregata]KAK0113573.1 hypothetical protein ONS96_014430 [Cadophora gregata f. sp. sojae]KAK0114329.1 hypothetical protein ONS95_013822 [Cadophora gregata]
MCHLCRKAQALESNNNKALKPVGLALARLHRDFGPDLEHLWIWRFDATLRLRIALAGLHKVVPVAAITEMLNEVDDELLHCQKQMADHQAVEVRGTAGSSSEVSDNSIMPSESASMQARKKMEQETAVNTTQDGSLRRNLEEKRNTPQYSPSGSDLDPHPVLIKRSCLIVEAWLEDCDAVATAINYDKESDGVSVVSVPGRYYERPQLDIRVWKRDFRNEGSSPASFTPRGSHQSSQYHCQPVEPKDSPHYADLYLDSLVTDKMTSNASPKQKVKFIEKVFSALQRNKSKSTNKMQGKERVRFDEKSHQRRRVKRQNPKIWETEEKHPMIDEDARQTLTVSHLHTNAKRQSNMRTSSSISSTNETSIYVDKKTESWDSNSSLLSSRDSQINLGSIIGRPTVPFSGHLSTDSFLLPLPQGSGDFQPSPPKPNPFWANRRLQSHDLADAQISHGPATSSTNSRYVKTLRSSFVPIVPHNYATNEPSESDSQEKRERRRVERNAATPAAPQPTANFAHFSESHRRVASPVARDLTARRAKRASKASVTEKYHRDERQRFWSSEKA